MRAGGEGRSYQPGYEYKKREKEPEKDPKHFKKFEGKEIPENVGKETHSKFKGKEVPQKGTEPEIDKFKEHGDAFKKSMEKIRKTQKEQYDSYKERDRRRKLAGGEDEMEIRRKQQQWVDAPEKKK